jgi:hypothetical protein
MSKEQKKCRCECCWCTRLPAQHKQCNWSCNLTTGWKATPIESTECQYCDLSKENHETGVYHIFVPRFSSPTKPDTEWEKEFDKEFCYSVLYSASSDLSAGKGMAFKSTNPSVEDVKSFIRQEKEKSYQRGWEDGIAREWNNLYNKARGEHYHSAYSEIIDMVEKEERKYMSSGRDIVFEDLLSMLKEKLNKK